MSLRASTESCQIGFEIFDADGHHVAGPFDLAETQNVSDIPISIFRVPSTLVGWPKNGDVIVPL